MSFDHTLAPELQSAVFAFLEPYHTLSTGSRISHAIKLAALSPASFRTRLFLDHRTIDALLVASPAAYTLLTHATAFEVEYSERSLRTTKQNSRSPSSAASSRSLLDFARIRSLRLRVRPSISLEDMFSRASPPSIPDSDERALTTLNALLQAARGRGSDVRPLPQLTYIAIAGMTFDSTRPMTREEEEEMADHSTPTSPRLNPDQIGQLLQLDSLRELAYWGTKLNAAVHGSAFANAALQAV